MRILGVAITCLAGVAMAIALAGGPAGAQEETPLETLTVPANSGSNVLSTTTLESGKRYKLVATETWSESNGNDTYYHDAIYCFDEAPKRDDLCSAKPQPFGGKLYVGYETSGTITAFPSYLGASNPPYTTTHRYEVPFTADRTARLRAFIVPQQNFSEGQVVLELYKLPDTAPATSGCGTSKIAKAAACEITYEGNTITMKLSDPGKSVTVTAKKAVTIDISAELLTLDLTPEEMKALNLLIQFYVRQENKTRYCMTVATLPEEKRRDYTDYLRGHAHPEIKDVAACADALEVFLEAGNPRETRATAAANGCNVVAAQVGRGKRRAAPLRVTCRRRGPFTQLVIKPRRGVSLRRVLGRRMRVAMYRRPSAPRSSRRISLAFSQRRR